jgi:DNA-binding XRE family transcriptional regulator
MKKRKDLSSLDKLRQGLEKIPGMSKLMEEERASLRAAEFVKKARKAADLSQAALAKKIDVSQARISQMEKGKAPYGPSITLLERVARACGGTLHVSFQKLR